MAAELVIWENLVSTLARNDVALLLPRQEEPDRLEDLLRRARGQAVALAGRNYIHRIRAAMQDHSDNLSDNLIHGQQEVASIQQETRSFPCLSVLKIWNSPNLISFPSFIGVSDIDLRNVNHLVFTERAKSATMPKSKLCTSNLQIKGCLGLIDFGLVRNGFQGLPSLKELVMNSCDELMSLASEITQLTSLESLEISNCKLLDFSEDSAMQTTVLQEEEHPWMNLKSLSHLKLKELPKMMTLPDCLKHVKSLKTLWISACPSLKSLPERISCLTELRHLRIESWRALKRLPQGLKDVKSLMKVEITECPYLMQHCREHTGKDRPKINHARVLLHKSQRYRHV